MANLLVKQMMKECTTMISLDASALAQANRKDKAVNKEFAIGNFYAWAIKIS